MKTKELEKQIKELFNCSYDELDDACWKVIVNSNDYFDEGKVGITNIEEIPPYKNIPLSIRLAICKGIDTSNQRRNTRKIIERNNTSYINFGVYKYEKNYAIGYKMTNKDGSYCGTTVYWSSFCGGRLSHGTNGTVSFKVRGITPGIEVNFTICNNDRKIDEYFVCFGGELPSLEEKFPLIKKIVKTIGVELEINYYVIQPDDRPFVQWNHRYRNCKSGVEFIKKLLYGYYTKPIKKQSIVKLSKLLGTSLDNTLLYKYTYLDGGVEYVRVPSPFKKKEEELPF